MNPTKNNSECFEEVDISHDYYLEPWHFYLASTEETVFIGTEHVGVLKELSFPIPAPVSPLAIGSRHGVVEFNLAHVHLNAPYHWPGSNHNITLEIFSQERVVIRAGSPACKLFIQQLYPECESPYNSKYNGQVGPTVSRSHL